MYDDLWFNGSEFVIKGSLVCDIEEFSFISSEVLKDDEVRT